MRKNLLNLSILAIGTLFFASCAKKTDSTPTDVTPSYPNQFTINGGVFKNATISFKTVAVDTGCYVASQNMTSMAVEGTSGDSLILGYGIAIPGSKTGSVTLSTGNMQIQTDNNLGSNFQIYEADPTTIVKITGYGNVGGQITGTFAGTFNDNGVDIYQVSNGAFSVKRTANQ